MRSSGLEQDARASPIAREGRECSLQGSWLPLFNCLKASARVSEDFSDWRWAPLRRQATRLVITAFKLPYRQVDQFAIADEVGPQGGGNNCGDIRHKHQAKNEMGSWPA